MSKPLRVAQVVGKMHGGGVEAVVMNYYRHIDHSKVQFDFLVDSDSTLVPAKEIECFGGRVIEIPPYQQLPRYLNELEALFHSEQWSIVHSHINALSVFPLRAAKRAGVPVRIAHSHSTSGKGELAKNLVKALLKTQANRYPTHRFACSRYAGEWLFGRNKSFEIVYNAIDLSRFAFDLEVRKKVRAELGLSENQFVVGHVGRFMTQKNHAFLIDVFAGVVERRRDATLLLVGTGDLRPCIEQRVSELGITDNVMFLGQRSEANQLYQAFDVFVLPSLYEGLCLVGIEAQRAGLPCLLSDQITREVNVTNSVQFLSLADKTAWVSELCALEQNKDRHRAPDCFSNYNIEEAAKRLVERYCRLEKKVQ